MLAIFCMSHCFILYFISLEPFKKGTVTTLVTGVEL